MRRQPAAVGGDEAQGHGLPGRRPPRTSPVGPRRRGGAARPQVLQRAEDETEVLPGRGQDVLLALAPAVDPVRAGARARRRRRGSRAGRRGRRGRRRARHGSRRTASAPSTPRGPRAASTSPPARRGCGRSSSGLLPGSRGHAPIVALGWSEPIQVLGWPRQPSRGPRRTAAERQDAARGPYHRPAPAGRSAAGASFWTAAAVAALALWTSGAPSVSYPLYAAEWHLTPTTTNAIFAVYPIVLVVVLIVLGDLSDHIGRRASIVLGLLGDPGRRAALRRRAERRVGLRRARLHGSGRRALAEPGLGRHGRLQPARPGGPGQLDHHGRDGDRAGAGHAGRRRPRAVRARPAAPRLLGAGRDRGRGPRCWPGSSRATWRTRTRGPGGCAG